MFFPVYHNTAGPNVTVEEGEGHGPRKVMLLPLDLHARPATCCRCDWHACTRRSSDWVQCAVPHRSFMSREGHTPIHLAHELGPCCVALLAVGVRSMHMGHDSSDAFYVQELFELLSAQLSAKWAVPTLGPCCLSVEADSNIACSRGLGAIAKPGMYLLIPTSTHSTAMPTIRVDGSVEADELIERCMITAVAVGGADRVRLDRVFAEAIDTQQYWIQALQTPALAAV